MYISYFTGKSKQSSEPAFIKYIIESIDNEISSMEEIENTSTIIAEYKAFHSLIKRILEEKLYPIKIQSNSQVIIQHMTSSWNNKKQQFYKLDVKTNNLLNELPQNGWKLSWIRQDHNKAKRNEESL